MNLSNNTYSQDSTIIHLWPGNVPGSQSTKHPAVVIKDGGGDVTRLTDGLLKNSNFYTDEDGSQPENKNYLEISFGITATKTMN